MRIALVTLALLFGQAGWALAQDVRVGTPVGGDPPSGYDRGGRRDPFISLVVPRRPTPAQAGRATPIRRSGLGALSLADATIRGIVRYGDEMMAIVEGPDNQSFVLHVKDRLFDAEVKAIDERGVLFVERMEGTTLASPREIRKRLRPAGEGIR